MPGLDSGLMENVHLSIYLPSTAPFLHYLDWKSKGGGQRIRERERKKEKEREESAEMEHWRMKGGEVGTYLGKNGQHLACSFKYCIKT